MARALACRISALARTLSHAARRPSAAVRGFDDPGGLPALRPG